MKYRNFNQHQNSGDILKPKTDKQTGREYVVINGEKCYVDELVAEMFVPKPPNMNHCTIRHKDGNVKNNCYTNLEWVPTIPNPAVGPYASGSYMIDENGNIFDEGNQMHITDSQYESDMDLFKTVDPYFLDKDQRIVRVDDVIEGADGYVAGDKNTLTNPAILHKDHDRMNYRKDNLQWVERDSQEYQDYYNAAKQAIRENNVKKNPTKRFPDFLQPK